MNAQVFYLKNQEQESLCNEIVRLLKKDVFENESIYIDRGPISENYSKASPSQEHELCRMYVKLLKASMITMTDDFPIVVSDNDGNWCYMGGEQSGSDKPDKNFLQLFHKSMTLAFPAVAIMDRMIMLPKGIHEALSGGNFQWLLKPLEVGGVILVDFRDPVSRGEGARLLGSRLQTEIGKLCRRHMLANKSSRPDFEQLAKLLRIEKTYLEDHQKEILKSMIMLTAKIVSGSAQLAKSSLVTLDIQNESGTVLEGVRVLVRVPGNLEPVVKKTFNFPAHGEGTQRIEFPVSPKALPFCPLEVRFETSEASQAYVPFSIPLLLEVSSPDLTPPGAAPNAPPPRTSRNEDQGESAREKDPRPLLAMPDATLPTVQEAPSPGGSTGGAAAESVTSAPVASAPATAPVAAQPAPRRGDLSSSLFGELFKWMRR